MTPRDAVRAAANARDEVARRIASLKERLGLVAGERRAAESAAEVAAVEHKKILADNAAGGPHVDPDAANADRDASASHASDVRDAEAGLRERLAAMDLEHDKATRMAARARKERRPPELPPLEQDLRAKAHDFAQALQAFHQNAVTANAEHFNESGQLGNVVPCEGRAGLLVSNSDEGIPGIFSQYSNARVRRDECSYIAEEPRLKLLHCDAR